jgi:hypothetical protein
VSDDIIIRVMMLLTRPYINPFLLSTDAWSSFLGVPPRLFGLMPFSFHPDVSEPVLKHALDLVAYLLGARRLKLAGISPTAPT